MGPCDVLQDLCSRTLCCYPLSQQVSVPPHCAAWMPLVVNPCIALIWTGIINPKKEVSAWPITLHPLTFWSSAMMDVTLWYEYITYIFTFPHYWLLLHSKTECFAKLLNCICQVGQVHGGLMGIIQRAMSRSCPHIWFERAEMKDRHLVTKRFTFSGLSLHVFLWLLQYEKMLIFSWQVK